MCASASVLIGLSIYMPKSSSSAVLKAERLHLQKFTGFCQLVKKKQRDSIIVIHAYSMVRITFQV